VRTSLQESEQHYNTLSGTTTDRAEVRQNRRASDLAENRDGNDVEGHDARADTILLVVCVVDHATALQEFEVVMDALDVRRISKAGCRTG
jgi:hypothetical protein